MKTSEFFGFKRRSRIGVAGLAPSSSEKRAYQKISQKPISLQNQSLSANTKFTATWLDKLHWIEHLIHGRREGRGWPNPGF